MAAGGHAGPTQGVETSMSNTTLDRPSSSTRTAPRARDAAPAPVVEGSYVDRDGVRLLPRRIGAYAGPSPSAVGSYTDRDGVRRATRPGSYTRVDA